MANNTLQPQYRTINYRRSQFPQIFRPQLPVVVIDLGGPQARRQKMGPSLATPNATEIV